MKLSNTMLRVISQEVLNGNPWWGMVVANEYLSSSSPLLKAVENQFKSRIGAAASSPLAQHLLAGERFADLPLSLRDEVGGRFVNPRQKTPASYSFSPITIRRRASMDSRLGQRMISRHSTRSLRAARAAPRDAHIAL